MTFLAIKRYLLRIFVINGCIVNWEIVNFLDWPLQVLYIGSELKNDMSGQSNDSLRLCNVKMRKCLLGHKLGTFPSMHGLQSVVSSDLNNFFTSALRHLSLAVTNRFWPISSRFRCSTVENNNRGLHWVEQNSIFWHCNCIYGGYYWFSGLIKSGYAFIIPCNCGFCPKDF